MTLPVPDRHATLAALDVSTQRFLDLVASVPDTSRPAIGVWDVGDVVNHVSQIFGMYAGITRGEGSPLPDHLRGAEYWRTRVAQDHERDVQVLSERIRSGLKEFKEALEDASWESEVPWHGGVASPVSSLPGALLNETEVHGLDIARASNRQWHIPHDNAVTILTAHLPWLPHYVDKAKAPDKPLSFDIRLRRGPRFVMSLENGEMTIDSEPRGKVDCHMSVDPVTYLLVGYGRTSQIRASAKGKVFVWGRRPWVALKMAQLFIPV